MAEKKENKNGSIDDFVAIAFRIADAVASGKMTTGQANQSLRARKMGLDGVRTAMEHAKTYGLVRKGTRIIAGMRF